MNRWMKCAVGSYLVAFAINLVGCSSDNIPKGTIRSGIGVPTTISLRVLPSDIVAENTEVPVIATVKDELGNPAEGPSVIFTTNATGQSSQTVSLVAGQALATFTFTVSSTIIGAQVPVTITAFVGDIQATRTITVTNVD